MLVHCTLLNGWKLLGPGGEGSGGGGGGGSANALNSPYELVALHLFPLHTKLGHSKKKGFPITRH